MATVSTASEFTAARPARAGGRLPGAASKAPLLMFLAAGALLPWAVGDYWTFNVTVGLILAVSCLGLQVLTGWTKQISLMQAGLTGAAVHLDSYLFGSCYCDTGLRHHFLFAAAVTIAVTVAVSIAVAVLGAPRPLIYSLVATVAVQYTFDDTIFRPPRYIGLLSPPPRTPRQFLDLDLSGDRRYYFYAFAVLLVVLVGVHRLRCSRFGRAMIAVGNDPISAATQGISPVRARVGAFAVAGLLAGVAGVLNAVLFLGDPGYFQWTSFQSLVYVAVAVVAGSRSGIVLVVVAVTTTLVPVPRPEFQLKIPTSLFAGTAMLLFLLLPPLGLERLTTSLRRRRDRPRPVPSLELPIPTVHTGWRNVSRRAIGLAALSVTLVGFGLSVAVRHDHRSLPAGITEYKLAGNLGLSAITLGPDGNLWFTEEHRIGRITPTGQVTEFGELPAAGETYSRIVAVAGSLWFTESGGTVGRIGTQGTITRYVGTGLGTFTAGPGGSVWIASGALTRISSAGAVTRVRTPHVQPSLIVAGPDGSMWFTGRPSSRIWRIAPAGQITSYGGLPAGAEPDAIATAPDGNLWFTVRLSNKIWRITPAGLITSYGGLPANAQSSAMIAGPDGNLWFTEDNRINNRIWRITPAGQITSYGGLPANGVPGRLTPGPDGNLWVVYREDNVTLVSLNRIMGNHTLARITPAGVITTYRLPGPDLGSLTAGPDGTLWFTAEHDDWYYPGPARIGRIAIAQLAGGHVLPPAAPTG